MVGLLTKPIKFGIVNGHVIQSAFVKTMLHSSGDFRAKRHILHTLRFVVINIGPYLIKIICKIIRSCIFQPCDPVRHF